MTYWLDQAGKGPIGKIERPSDGGILIIGSGLAGVSTAYFLQKNGFEDITIVDCGTENASYFRNAGHMLVGTCENYLAMSAIHGREKTRTIFSLSEQFILQYQATIKELDLSCDYHQGDYFFVGASPEEGEQLSESVKMMQEDGLSSSYMVSEEELESYGFKNAGPTKGCTISSQANPAKFRNQLLDHIIQAGGKYHSFKVKEIEDNGESVRVNYMDASSSGHDAVVIAGNAYSPQYSKYFQERRLVEPFKGQIIVSKPLKAPAKRMEFSCEHGYIYGTITADNRILIGGWRNNIPGGETGGYDLQLNTLIEDGLKQHVKDHFDFEDVEWEYSWAGIMGSSNTGLPHIGPTNNPLIYACSSFSGYGFSFAHGSGKLLADIMTGNQLPKGWEYFTLKG